MFKFSSFSVYNIKQNVKILTSRFSSSSNVKYEEVTIPVPWGCIAGKWWGTQTKRPVLVLHGWQDNCGSYDRLIPLLPQNVGYLAIDFPGHGKSSHLPPGMFYHFMNGSFTIHYIKDYFKWDKCSFLGHSLGSIMAYTFTSLFPKLVDYSICMDALNPLVFKNRIDVTVKSINQFMKYDALMKNEKDPPCYTFEEIEQLLHKASRKSITVENAKYILERNIAPANNQPGKYYFSRDVRLKCGPLLGWTEEDCFEAAERVDIPLLFTLADGTEFAAQKSTIEKVIEILKKHNKNFVTHKFNGTHHVHLNDPQQVANAISPFIIKYNKE